MVLFKPQSIQVKFLLGFAAIVLTLGLFFSASLYFHLRSLLHSQVVDKSELILGQVDSVQSYVRETLRPKMFSVLPPDEFIIEAMSSSYISRRVMNRLNHEDPQYHYRRVAINARNPEYEANDTEKSLIDWFRQNPERSYWEGYKKLSGEEFYVKARPVRFYDSCMHCHGVPEEAPKVLLERYGDTRGFGREANALDGVVMVGLPVEGAVKQIREATVGYIGLYAAGMLMFFGITQFFFNRLVVSNLRRLTVFFKSRFQDEAEVRVIEKLEQGDEIEEMVHGMEELGDHLLEARTQLKNYAGNLEQMVEDRTQELSREASERQADVKLFVDLLEGLNRSQSRREMWRNSLPQIARRFNASSVGFRCTLVSQTFYAWPDPDKRPELPENWQEILVECKPHFADKLAVIPVGASASVAEGLLFLSWEKGVPRKQQDREVLIALGQQLGIAMENLSALDNIVRQKDVLQTVVEGISDPLLFMDESCGIALANTAARLLAGSFVPPAGGGAEGDPGVILPFLMGEEGPECPVKSAIRSGEPFAKEVRTGEGSIYSISMYPVPGAAQGGRIVVYIRDITTERRMLVQMQQQEKLATVGKLASGLAHEMNNPLGVILCYAELLKNYEIGAHALEDIEVIIRHTKQARNVLQDLLNFARPKKADTGLLDLNAVVTDTAKVFRVQADAGKIALDIDVMPEIPPIKANRQTIEQILTNLLINALDEVEKGTGRIVVSAKYDENAREAVITVADNGPGIPEDHIARLFDPFFTTKEVGKGSGLGLAVVYGLVQDLGGRIEVTGEDGAVFTIHLPVDGDREER